MSFITKRERVFNDYELFDLPARNEGKLKAYESCTDSRAWSHFHSDKAEHLQDIIKRNNEKCNPKYVPTKVIVDTLMVAKNAEISKLKRRIAQFEQMLAAYDQLDLDTAQKSEIAKAHEAIRAANKDLDDLYFDLDLSGFTEFVDSEAFATGKSHGEDSERLSRGDDVSWSFEKEIEKSTETKAVQSEKFSGSDKSTHADDPRIKEMEEAIICKDAKLNAMQNTAAVMENDVCEPYCVYAHIYTALEKIFGVLCQNDKYKEYLDLLVSGKDMRNIDIKGKIIFKLKVLEKFSHALIAPCALTCKTSPECSCCYAEVLTRIDTAFSQRSLELKEADNKRAQLVADIIENDEIKEILSNKSSEDSLNRKYDDCSDVYYTNIDTENLRRLKELQASYDELLTMYEDLKHEKNCVQIKCAKYNDMETELESLRLQLKEYETLWNEKEHYKRRSIETDDLKQKYLVLYEETANLETQLKAENEINNMRLRSINELRDDNMELERRLTQTSLSFEKERNSLQCKLKEAECKCMCYDEQVKSLSIQVDSLLAQDHEKPGTNPPDSIILLNEIQELKEETKHLKDLLSCSEDEKQTLQEQFQDKLNLINELKMEIEDWKSSYEKTVHRNDYLEKYAENISKEIDERLEENKILTQDLEEKTVAVENLLHIINNKSIEINRLLGEIEHHKSKYHELEKLLNDADSHHSSCVEVLENEKKETIKSLELAKKESLELLNKIKAYDDLYHKHNDMVKSLENQTKEKEELINLLSDTLETNKRLQEELAAREDKNAFLSNEIKRLREINDNALSNINSLQDEKQEYKKSLDIARKESENLERKFEDLSNKFIHLKESNESIEKQLVNQKSDFNNATLSINICKKKSDELLGKIKESEKLKEDFKNITQAYDKLLKDKALLHEKLSNKNNDLENLQLLFDKIKQENINLSNELKQVPMLEQKFNEIQKEHDSLILDNDKLLADVNMKIDEINNLYNKLQEKEEESRTLSDQVKSFKHYEDLVKKNLHNLETENENTRAALETARKKSVQLIEKLNDYESLEQAYDELKESNDRLQKELKLKVLEIKNMEKEKTELKEKSDDLISHTEDLEKSLIDTRNQLISSEPSRNSIADFIREIQEMKKEKVMNFNRIRELLDKIDDLELLTTTLSEDLSARDDKIAVLENHINNLEDEVRQLHINLDEALDASEQLKDGSQYQIEDAIQKIEAHHSKATHNIKMELAKLENNEATKTRTKSKTEESIKAKYLSKVSQLKNEREIIAVELKQLEIRSVGDSALAPENCDLQDILKSMDNIRKAVEAKNNISSTLQQTMLKVQTSSQLLLSKADEAKRLAEKEKQKIETEKEEAITERLKLEQEVTKLKETLKNEINKDKDLIKDLEAELLNHKIIIEKINESSKLYVSKLEHELESLGNLYRTALEKIDEREKTIQDFKTERQKDSGDIQKLNELLKEKNNEIMILQNALSEFKSKSYQSIGIQAYRETNFKDIWTQTASDGNRKSLAWAEPDENETMKVTNQNEAIYADALNSSKLGKDRKGPHRVSTPSHRKKNTEHLNEVQILTANIEPAFDFDKSSYLKNKVNQLTPGPTEQVSISSDEEITEHVAKNKFSEKEYFNRPNSSKTFYYNQSAKSKGVKSEIIPKLGSSKSEIILPSISNGDASSDNNMLLIYNDSDDKIFNDDKQRDDQKELKNINPTVNMEYTKEELKSTNSFEIGLEYADKLRPSSTKTSDSDKKSLERDFKSVPSFISQTYKKLDLKTQLPAFTSSKAESQNNNLPDAKTTIPDFKTKTPEIKRKSNEERITSPVIMSIKSPKNSLLEPKNKTKEVRTKSPETKFKTQKVKTKVPEARTPSPDAKPKLIEARTKSPETKKIIPETKSKSPYVRSTSPDATNEVADEISIIEEVRDTSPETRIKLPESKAKSLKVRDTSPETRIKLPESKAKSLKRENRLPKTNKKLNQTIKNSAFLIKPEEKLLATNEIQQYNSNEHNSKEITKNPLVSIKPDKEHSVANNLRDSVIGYNYQNLNKFNSTNLQRHPSAQIVNEKSFENRFKDNHIKNDKIIKIDKLSHRSRSVESLSEMFFKESEYLHAPLSTTSHSNKSYSVSSNRNFTMLDKGVLVKMDASENFENKIRNLTQALEDAEKDSKKKIEAIKQQYDANIKDIINEHNQGVRNMQSLHEETLHDILSIHENEVESLRSMSIEAMRKVEQMEKESNIVKNKVTDHISRSPDQEPVKLSTKSKKRKSLTQTMVEAFNVKPRARHLGPCTCSFDVNISDTIRTIFEQVDIEQRKLAEQKYLKYVANKLANGNLETLDAEELSFLHFKVCRTWKVKLSKEEALKKRIDSLESELINKQRHAQEHIAALDQAVAEERRQLQEVREAICRSIMPSICEAPAIEAPPERDMSCQCNTHLSSLQERLSAGDLMPPSANAEHRSKRKKPENGKGIVARVVVEDRRERRLYHDEPPTRLRRPPDRGTPRTNKK